MKKKSFLFFVFGLATVVFMSCGGNKSGNSDMVEDSVEVAVIPDTTVYGVCGDGTSMHSLELVTDEGDTLTYAVNRDTDVSVIKGGMLVGDRMAVVGTKKEEGEMSANCVINITTLLGKWTSIDKRFEIQEGGVVVSTVKAESRPWTSWKICNCNLLLNADTFSIEGLGADSLYLENKDGIFAFKRLRQ